MQKGGCPTGFIQIGDSCLSPSTVKIRFRDLAKQVWRNPDIIDKISIDVVQRTQKNLLSIFYSSHIKPMAIGDSLLRCASEVRISISEEAQKLTMAEFDNYLKHESIHLGYPQHDKGFRDLAEKHHIPVTVNMSQGGKVQLREKIGNRYQTIQEFPDYDAAKRFFDENIKDKKQGRFEIRY